MSEAAVVRALLLAVPLILAGTAIGWVYFRAMRLTVDALASGSGWLRPAALTFGRIGLALLLFALAARLGAAALLAALAGFTIARRSAVRTARRAR